MIAGLGSLRVVLSRTCRVVACCGVSLDYMLPKDEYVDLYFEGCTHACDGLWGMSMVVGYEGTNILSIFWIIGL